MMGACLTHFEIYLAYLFIYYQTYKFLWHRLKLILRLRCSSGTVRCLFSDFEAYLAHLDAYLAQLDASLAQLDVHLAQLDVHLAQLDAYSQTSKLIWHT